MGVYNNDEIKSVELCIELYMHVLHLPPHTEV